MPHHLEVSWEHIKDGSYISGIPKLPVLNVELNNFAKLCKMLVVSLIFIAIA